MDQIYFSSHKVDQNGHFIQSCERLSRDLLPPYPSGSIYSPIVIAWQVWPRETFYLENLEVFPKYEKYKKET